MTQILVGRTYYNVFAYYFHDILLRARECTNNASKRVLSTTGCDGRACGKQGDGVAGRPAAHARFLTARRARSVYMFFKAEVRGSRDGKERRTRVNFAGIGVEDKIGKAGVI